MQHINRRRFIGSVAAAGAAVTVGAFSDVAQAQDELPWHQKLRRVGQLNFNERDPLELDVTAWAEYWASLEVDAVLLNVTGMVAFYPTEISWHCRSPYLNGRDFFGDCLRAAKQRGLRVIGRMSPDLQWGDALNVHPEWFMRDGSGKRIRGAGESINLYRTCMFSTYYTEQIPAIMREVNTRYAVDGLFTNGWPPFSMPVCYCENCEGLPERRTPAFREKFMDRVIELWKLYESIAMEKGPENVYFGNLGGGARAGVDLERLGEVARWFNADNQGRTGATPTWVCAQQGRVAWSVMKGQTTTNVTGAWATGAPRWRNAAKAPAEAEMWMAQTVASGMVVWYHWLGAQTGLGEDRRWQETGRRFLQWHARHDEHFTYKRSVANLGVVLGQRTLTFHRPLGRGDRATDHLDGFYYALLEGRFPFDMVHEDDLEPERLKKYSALVLPNVSLLSDKQCRQLDSYVASGGSLLATFETALYDEQYRPREDFGLASLFEMKKAGARQESSPSENASYSRIERDHEILSEFDGTNWLPGTQRRIPVTADGEAYLTVVPPYPAYPTEVLYSRTPRTEEPAVVIRERGASRLIYFPGDVGRTFWLSGNTDIGLLLRNSVRWLLRNQTPVTIEGDGVIEFFAWETERGYAVHILNYNNPNLHRGYIRKYYPIGPQHVRMALPAGQRVSRVELLRAERDIPFRIRDGHVEFTVPGVVDYEVAAMHVM